MPRFDAPFSNVETTTYLPNPRLGDSVRPRGTVQLHRKMDGPPRTYIVQRANTEQMTMLFQLSYEKALELKDFASVYLGREVRYVDHNQQHWRGYIISNPLEIEGVGRRTASPGGEDYRVQVIFEGRKI